MLAYFYTNFLEYNIPRAEGGKLLMPVYLPEDFRAPFVDPVSGPHMLWPGLTQHDCFDGSAQPGGFGSTKR